MIGHLCLIDFILFRHIKENGLESEMGSGVYLCVEKVLGTPWHPLRNGYLPSSVPLRLLSINLLVLIMYKYPDFRHAIYQEWQTQFWLHSVLFRLFISPSLIFVFFKVLGSSMVGSTWNPNTECQNKQLCFWCHIWDLFTLDSQE